MMSNLAERVAFLLMDVSIKSVLLIVAAAVIALMLRRASAAQRHLVWTLALGATLCLPLFSAFVPSHPVPIITKTIAADLPQSPPLTIDQSHALPTGSETPSLNEHPILASNNDTESPVRNNSRPLANIAVSKMPVFLIVSAVWMLGVLLFLGRLGIAMLRLNALQRRLIPLTEGTMANEANEIVWNAGIQKSVRFFMAHATSVITVPLTWGFSRPVIVLPANAVEWPIARLRAALLHETAHVKRGDWLLQMLASVTCALYWFNPLIWAASHKMRQESERAADDYAVTHGLRTSEYAAHLLDIAQSVQDRRQLPHPAIAMARQAKVEGRIKAVLASGHNRKPLNRKVVIAITLSLGIVLIPLASIRLISQTSSAANASVISSGKVRASRGILEFRYLRDIQPTGFPGSQTITMQDNGVDAYTFFDKRTGKSFRDIRQLKAAFSQLVIQGIAPRHGASSFRIPRELQPLTNKNTVYFTSEQQRTTYALVQELARWQGFLHDSPVIVTDADIEPHATAHLGGATQSTPSLAMLFTGRGTKLFRDFTTAHFHEILGIFVDGNLVSAPMINEPITDGEGELSGNFHSLAEAQALANRLNTPGPEGAVPSDRLASFRNAVELNPNDADAQYTLAEALRRMSWQQEPGTQKRQVTSPPVFDESILHLQKAVVLRPGNAIWLFELTSSLEDRGRYSEVVPLYQNELKRLGPPETFDSKHRTVVQFARSSNRTNCQILLAYALIKTQQYPKAIAQFEEALRLEPQAYWALLGYGDALNKVGRSAEARMAWTKLITQPGANPTLIRQAKTRLVKK